MNGIVCKYPCILVKCLGLFVECCDVLPVLLQDDLYGARKRGQTIVLQAQRMKGGLGEGLGEGIDDTARIRG